MEVKKDLRQTNEKTIPSDWALKPIGEHIDLLTGFPFPSNQYTKSGIKLLRGSNVKRGVIDWSDDITQYWIKVTADITQYTLMEGDIVIAMDGSLVGRSFARLTKADLPALLLQRVARIRTNKIYAGYLKEFICSEYFTKHCDAVKTSSAIPHISSNDIRSFTIPIPPTIEEQTAIATALSNADALISSLEKLIAKKRNIKEGAMQQLLQPKEGWDFLTYGEIFTFLKTATYSRAELSTGGSIGYVHYGDIHTKWDIIIDISKTELPSVSEKQLKAYSILEDGDIIMADASEDYSGIGKCVEVKNIGTNKIISGLHTFLLRDKKGILVNGFKGYLHVSPYIKNQFDKLATGMKVYGVSKANLKTVVVPVPPKEEQNRIASILSEMEEEINALEYKLDKYRKVKNGMMQQLLTGKIRLV